MSVIGSSSKPKEALRRFKEMVASSAGSGLRRLIALGMNAV
jgi:hypothetical protein